MTTKLLPPVGYIGPCEVWLVHSSTTAGRVYRVIQTGDNVWSCDCLASGVCRHIRSAQGVSA